MINFTTTRLEVDDVAVIIRQPNQIGLSVPCPVVMAKCSFSIRAHRQSFRLLRTDFGLSMSQPARVWLWRGKWAKTRQSHLHPLTHCRQSSAKFDESVGPFCS